MKCKVQPAFLPNGTLVQRVPLECTKAVDPTLVAPVKRPTARRFDFGFSALPSQAAILSQTVSWFKLKGVRTAVLFFSSHPEWQQVMVPPALAEMSANGIQVLFVQYLPARGVALTPAQVEAAADRVIAADPDLFIFASNPQLPGEVASAVALLRKFRDRDYTPRAISLPGGTSITIASALNSDRMGDGAFVYGVTFNQIKMRGPGYDASAPDAWEPFRSNGSVLSPEIMRREIVKTLGGETKPISMEDGFNIPQIVMQLYVILAKLFELAGTDDPPQLQLASASMSVPSIAGLLQFDQYGRMAQADQFVTQHGFGNGVFHLITPMDVGVPDVFPMPTWRERIGPLQGSASFLGTATERGCIAATVVVGAYLVAMMVGVGVLRESAVIKSSSPLFAALVLLGGLVCISSNFGNSFFALEEGCAANAWLLTLGFTMMVRGCTLYTHTQYGTPHG
jgi:hypothetical protein